MTKAKWQCLSGSWLKMIAIVTMLIDHVTYFLLAERLDILQPLFIFRNTEVSVYYLLRTVGRLAFPLYCFLLSEGFLHTRDRRRYGINLLLFALISELPWDFVHAGTWFYERQNVFFTLFFGYCALCILEYLKKRPILQAIGLFGVLVLAYLFKADYGYMGVVVIVAMHMLKSIPLVRVVVCTCLFNGFWRAGLAFIPITLYNGERGFIKGRVGKYLCYAFYPLHLLVLGILRFYILAPV